MKRLLLFLAFAASCFAAGTVQQTTTQLGNSDTWVLTYRWTGDSVNGSVPVTPGKDLASCCQGFVVTSVQVIPGTPAPSQLYSVALPDGSGIDILGGAATQLSSTVAAAFSPSGATIPLQGTISLTVTGQSVPGAKGVLSIYLVKPSAFTVLQSPQPSSVNWITQLTNKPVIDVRSFGADPTGTKDSTAAIQAALNAGAGNEVLVPAGFFNVPGTLSVPSGTWLHGAGIGATQINHTNSAVDLFTATGTSRTTISDMFIFGGGSTDGWAVNATGGVNFTARNLFIEQMPFGIRISGVSTAIVDFCNIRDLKPATGIGILSTGASIEARISNVIMDNAIDQQPAAGIAVDNSFYTQIALCEIIRSGTALFVSPTTGISVDDLSVSDSLFDSAASNAIALVPVGAGAIVQRPRFINTWASGVGFGFSGSSGSGVLINPTGGAQVIGATFRAMTVIFNRQTGIDIEGGANTLDTSIDSSQVYGNSYPPSSSGAFSGILVGSDVSGVSITNNVTGTSQATYQTQASGVQYGAGAGDSFVLTGNRDIGSTFAPFFTSPATGLQKAINNNLPTNSAASTIASASSVTLNGQPFVIYDVTGTASIATITEGWTGRQIVLTHNGAGTANLITGGNVTPALSLAQGSRRTCDYDGSFWQCQ